MKESWIPTGYSNWLSPSPMRLPLPINAGLRTGTWNPKTLLSNLPVKSLSWISGSPKPPYSRSNRSGSWPQKMSECLSKDRFWEPSITLPPNRLREGKRTRLQTYFPWVLFCMRWLPVRLRLPAIRRCRSSPVYWKMIRPRSRSSTVRFPKSWNGLFIDAWSRIRIVDGRPR